MCATREPHWSRRGKTKSAAKLPASSSATASATSQKSSGKRRPTFAICQGISSRGCVAEIDSGVFQASQRGMASASHLGLIIVAVYIGHTDYICSIWLSPDSFSSESFCFRHAVATSRMKTAPWVTPKSATPAAPPCCCRSGTKEWDLLCIGFVKRPDKARRLAQRRLPTTFQLR